MQDDSAWKPPVNEQDGSDDHEPDGTAVGQSSGIDPDAPVAAEPDGPSLPPVTPSPVTPSPVASPPPPVTPPGADASPSLPGPAPQAPPAMTDEPTDHTAGAASTHTPAAESPWTPAQAAAAAAATSGDTVIVQSSTPSDGRSKRSNWLVAGAAAAVVAVVASGVFAISNLTGSVQGGAASPDELGLTLMAAIENEDVLGVIDVLSPGERDVFRDPLVDLVSELTRLEVLSPDADLARILGLDVELSNELVRTEATNVADIANISMSADAVVSVDGADVPIGSLITDNVPADVLTELRGTKLTQTEEFEISLTAVEQEGRWYFSVFHSIAEAARADFTSDLLIPAEGIGADGGDTPEAAFNGLLDTVEALDLTGLMRRLNPGEAAALQRYAPLFVEDGQSLLDEVPLDWEITSREFRVEGDGETRTVMLDAIAIEGTIEETTFSVSYADGCLRAEADGESFEQCQDAARLADLDEMLADSPDAKLLVDTVTEAFADIEEVGLEMRRFDGLWYVSPTSTLTEGFLAALRALDRSEIDAIIEQAPAAFGEFENAIFDGFNMLPGTIMGIDDDEFVFADDQPVDVGVDGGIAVADDETFDIDVVDDDGSGIGVDPLDEAWSECYGEPDADIATACFTEVSDSAPEGRYAIPVALRFPECGYAISWGSEFYQLPDDEFIGAAEAARPCFLALVDQGAIQEWDLPSEILNLECFEGRNWYQVFDDPEYDDRYYACLTDS